MEPKNKKEFRKLVNSAYQAGWTYSSFTNELWVEYANRWNHFVDFVDALKANTIKNDETINLRLTKGFAPDGSVNYTASGPGDTVWVDGWNGGLAARRDPNTWLAQFRIQKNHR